MILSFLITLIEADMPYRPPLPPPMFRPISRAGPPSPVGLQRREPPPLVFPGSLHRNRIRDHFKAATAGIPMRTLMLQLRGSQTRAVPNYLRAPPAFKFLKPNSIQSSPSPQIIVKPIKLESLQQSVLNKGHKNIDYTFEKPQVTNLTSKFF